MAARRKYTVKSGDLLTLSPQNGCDRFIALYDRITCKNFYVSLNEPILVLEVREWAMVVMFNGAILKIGKGDMQYMQLERTGKRFRSCSRSER